MKKFIAIFALICLAFGAIGQTKVIKIAKGAAGVDSLNGAQTKYYYVKATGTTTTAASGPLADYYVFGIQALTTRSTTVTGTDSCHIWIEVSLDNTTWVKLTGSTSTVKTSGGGVYLQADDLVTTTTNGGAVFSQATNYYPYVRVAYQHYKASCTMFPTAWVVMKKY